MNQKIARLWKFLTDDIWRITEDEVNKTTFSVYTVIKTIYLCVNRFTKDRLANKAAALTYSTLFALIPILAVVFAIARGFGFDNVIEHEIATGFGGLNETSSAILNIVNTYLSQTKNGIFIGVGLIMLLWSVLNLINNMEIGALGRSFHLHEHHAEEHGRLHTAGPSRQVPGAPHPLCTDVVHVHRALHLHAQHESEIQARAHIGHPGRYRLSGLSVPLHQQPVVGVALQCHLR